MLSFLLREWKNNVDPWQMTSKEVGLMTPFSLFAYELLLFSQNSFRYKFTYVS